MKASWMSAWILGGLAASCGSVQEVKSNSQDGMKAAAMDDDEDDGEEDDGDEEELALDQVPASVKKAAEVAVPGFVLKSAEKETEEGALHYCLEGTAAGEAVEIEVSTDGKVLEIERGEDEDDD